MRDVHVGHVSMMCIMPVMVIVVIEINVRLTFTRDARERCVMRCVINVVVTFFVVLCMLM